MAEAIEVEAVDPSKKTSQILGPSSDEATVQMSEMDQKCYWNDAEFEQGAKVVADGKAYTCSFGKWLPED